MSQEASQDSGSDGVDSFSEKYDFQYVDAFLELFPNELRGYNIKIEKLLKEGRFKEAFPLHEHSCALFSKAECALKRSYVRWGANFFDISKAIVGLATGSPQPDADLIGPVEIRMTSNGCGRGLFATQDIQGGEVILISTALAVSHEPAMNPNSLLQIVKEALNSCGEKARQIFLSHCMKDRSRFIPKMSDFITQAAGGYQSDWAMLYQNFDELTEIVKDHHILGILELIAFDDSSPAAIKEKSREPAIFELVPARMYYGVWLLLSFANHSCVPNAATINVGHVMRIHATTPIKSGEEITIPYFNVLVPFPSRQESCSKFGFTCVCKRCHFEANIMGRNSEIKNLYSHCAQFMTISDLGKRGSELCKLLYVVEECVEYLHDGESLSDEDETSEQWYRASFTPVYFAYLLNRNNNVGCEENWMFKKRNFMKIANGMIQTCSGSLHSIAFFHELRRRLGSSHEEFIAHGASIAFMASFVYGSANLEKIIKSIVEQPI